jgi:hypothetical protein
VLHSGLPATRQWPLSRLTSDELVDLLMRRTPGIHERPGDLMERATSVCPRLVEMVRTAKDDRLGLAALRPFTSVAAPRRTSLEFLGHPSEHVRAWTVRLLGDERRVASRCLDRLVELARHEPSPTVRSQLACTGKRLPGPAALPIVEQLLGRSEDLADPHIPLLLWWAVEDKAISDRALVLKLVGWPAPESPITRAVIVGPPASRYLAEGYPAGFAPAPASLVSPLTSGPRAPGPGDGAADGGQHFDQAPRRWRPPWAALEQGRPSPLSGRRSAWGWLPPTQATDRAPTAGCRRMRGPSSYGHSESCRRPAHLPPCSAAGKWGPDSSAPRPAGPPAV